MKRWWIGIALVLIGVVTTFVAVQRGWLSQPAQGANAAQTTLTDTTNVVTDLSGSTGATEADARVVPVQVADLSLAASGIVQQLMVKEGDLVGQGQLLLKLDAAQQQVGVANAQAALQRAQARLAELQAGARTAEIDAAKANLARAQARYDQLAQASLPGDIAAAQAAVSAAQAGLQKVNEGASEAQLIAARSDAANAQAELRRAQRAYDQIKWRNDIGATAESANLERATNNYTAAQARLADLESGASAADVNNASAQVRRAQAQLGTLENGMPTQLVAAKADVQASQAQLDLLLAGARPEQIAAAQADVAAATAALQQALVSLANTELHAPFTGTVALLNVAVGEQLSPATPALRLADLANWQIETENLTELEAVGVQPGDSVQLSFDALPGVTMSGKVQRIRPIGGDNRGDIVYTVVIAPATQDKRLLWNMTTIVTLGN